MLLSSHSLLRAFGRPSSNPVTSRILSKRRITSGRTTACTSMASAVDTKFSQSQSTINFGLSQQQAQHHRLFHPSDHDLDSDLDELCKKHIELPADDFAYGCRFLHQIALGNIDEVKRIVSSESSKLVNFRDYDRRTPLHIAASEGHLEIAEFLVTKGARVNRSDRWGGSPLDDCRRHRHLNCSEYLQSVGACFGSSSQSTNFITAASEGDLEEVSTLLRLGKFDIDEGDYDKRTGT